MKKAMLASLVTMVLSLGLAVNPVAANAAEPNAGSNDGALKLKLVAPAKAESHWEGTTALITTVAGDVVGISGLVLASTANGNKTQEGLGAALGISGLAAIMLGPTIDQFVRGHIGKGFGTLGLRLGCASASAGVGMLVGMAAFDGDGWGRLIGAILGFGLGALVGVVSGQVIDLSTMYWETSEPSTVAVTPYVNVTGDSKTAGLVIRF
jgi:hypothetical protein